MKTRLFPYLTFNGNCREAIEFYKSILGGELTLQTFEESGMPCSPEEKNLIINSELKSDEINFMASDGGNGHAVTVGTNMSMSISGFDLEKLTGWFNKLAEGGKIDLPLEKQFWGDIYGQLTDKFDIHWMINIESEKPKKS